MNHYSVLLYKSEFTERTYGEIEKYINDGIKVYLITPELKEEVYENIFTQDQIKKIEWYKKKYLLSMTFDIEVSMKFGEEFKIYDGEISEDLKKELEYDSDLAEDLGEDYKPFNIEQYAIEHLAGEVHTSVAAGAGTGKTKTMIDRCMFLRHNEYGTFKEIVMITFTNKAAHQMKEKLLERIEAYYIATKNIKYLNWMDELSEMRIQTIHSFGKWFIEEHGDKINLDKRSKITSLTYEKIKILERLIHVYNGKYRDKFYAFRYIPQYKIIRSVLKIQEHISNRGIDIELFKDRIDWGKDDMEFNHFLEFLLKGMVREINLHKKNNNCIEMNDLIIKLREFSRNDNFGKIESIKYMMVDEFQDTDTIQVEFILWLIRNANCKAFIVGDIKQSIYRFRGADYTAFKEFQERFEKLKNKEALIHRTLKTNYRSSAKVIEAINGFFMRINELKSTNHELEKFSFDHKDILYCGRERLVTEKPSRSSAVKYFEKNEETILIDERVEYVIDRIEKNTKKDIAVLVRSNRDLEEIVAKLEEKGAVCLKEVSGTFYRNIAVREFYIMLKALIYPNVYLNQYAFINSSYGDGIENNLMFEKFNTKAKTDYLKKVIQDRHEYRELNELREKMKRSYTLKSFKEIIEWFKPHINYGVKLLRDTPMEDSKERIEKIETKVINYEMNLSHLMSILDKQFGNSSFNIADIEEFLRVKITTDNMEDEKMLKRDDGKYDVSCMTVHKSKGLEFDEIIIPKTSNDFLSSRREVDTFIVESGNESEIKIAYSINLEELQVKNDIYSYNFNEEDKEITAEEIRLLYVALTRAKKSIHVEKKAITGNYGKITKWMNVIERGNLKGE